MKMSPCGLVCSVCAIYRAAQDPFEAIRLAEDWKANGWKNAEPEWFKCEGCWGDRSVCWTEDCFIRRCAVDENGYSSCAECPRFPCDALMEWAAKSDHHEALQNLLRLREEIDAS